MEQIVLDGKIGKVVAFMYDILFRVAGDFTVYDAGVCCGCYISVLYPRCRTMRYGLPRVRL